MTIEEALKSYLPELNGLTDLVKAEDIYSSWVFKSGISYIVMTRVSTVFESSKKRVPHRSDVVIQLDVFSPSFAVCVMAVEILQIGLNGTSSDGFDFYVANVRDNDEEESKMFRRSIDVAVTSHS